MKFYIAGKITNLDNYKEEFEKAETYLRERGHSTMNPARMTDGFTHEEYMKVCYSMIDVCEMVYFLSNWKDSKGAVMECEYAIKQGKEIVFEDQHNNMKDKR